MSRTTACPYHDYYINQAGTGVGAIYRGSVYQRGHGIGSFLKGLLRTILPVFKSGIKTLGQEALSTGSHFLNDISQNVPIKDSFKQRFTEATNNLKRKAEDKINNLMNGSGVQPHIKKRKISKNNQKASKQRTVNNFNNTPSTRRKKVLYTIGDIFTKSIKNKEH